MRFQIFLWVIEALCVNRKVESFIPKKVVVQNEMSEHCRRRVVSSIFLGRQVAESSAEVMHFTRLELPYSCSISVRTESGSNIILVILSKSEQSIIRSCREGHDQLLVYEMGETFGGYWGALPEYVFNEDTRNNSTFYTLKTTQPANTMAETGSTDDDTVNSTQDIVMRNTQEKTDDNYVIMEVPLVNVSGNFVVGQNSQTELDRSDEEELFDLIYNVTPKNGVQYETSLMPILQFSIWNRKEGQSEKEPRYQLNNDMQEFTPDYRLLFTTNNHRRTFSKRRYRPTSHLKFNKKKNRTLFSIHNSTNRYQYLSNLRKKLYVRTEYIPITTANTRSPMDSIALNHDTDTWKLIASYLNLLNVTTKYLATSRENQSNDAKTLLEKISNMKHNSSIYLQSNLINNRDSYSSFTSKRKHLNIDKFVTNNITGHFSSSLPATSIYDLSHSVNSTPNLKTYSTIDESLNALSLPSKLNQTVSYLRPQTVEIQIQLSMKTDLTANTKELTTELMTSAMFESSKNHEDTTSLQPTSGSLDVITEKTRKSKSGSLVDHESWENIVQVAPVMADLLNITTPKIEVNTKIFQKKVIDKTYSTGMQNTMINREKRYIEALSIDEHRPRQLITKEDVSIPDRSKTQFDPQTLAELVELQDDEIQGRVALHYFKNYVGSTLFNMCDYRETKTRQVYLFNSSRIVIAVNNFTMDHITIVMTESRVARATGCPSAHLECQVAGVRVCIHHMNACDGVPNCGAYDVYDEDRLLCGGNVGLHYAVCLAACVFLAMLLTMLYSVHYWLKRCVPDVSRAFFVYTDKSETILYLDSIMRSPNDYDKDSRLVYHSSFFDDDDLSATLMNPDGGEKNHFITRFLRFICCKKSKHYYVDNNQQDPTYIEAKRKFSFTASELRKIVPTKTVNAAVQTGNSLEMAHLNEIRKSIVSNASVIPFVTKKQKNYLQKGEKEFTTIRQKQAITANLPSSSKGDSGKLKTNTQECAVSAGEEVELRSTTYDRIGTQSIKNRAAVDETKSKKITELTERRRNAAKHLRFEEGATTIEPFEAYDSDPDNAKQQRYHLNSNRATSDIEKDEEVPSSSGRDFKRFWRASKGKNKNKTQLPLQ